MNLKQPEQFGKYHLLDRINVGGMAEVFLAKTYGVKGFERLVAVKRILPSIAEDEEFVDMFIDEAKIAVELQHVNIAQIFELGQVNEIYYIALEYISGCDLQWISQELNDANETMPISHACFSIMQVCEGLHYAHNKRDQMGNPLGIVHRDVSPHNILVSFSGEVKLIDFGIAQAITKRAKTNAGILKGKFGYMSPEQVGGQHVDHRSDVFSCGIILYELLTGQRLFVGESDFATLEKIRDAQIPSMVDFNPDIPVELEHIVLRALAKDPTVRYQTTAEFHKDLESFVYASGGYCSTNTFAFWMKRRFAQEASKKTAQLESFRQLAVSNDERDRLSSDVHETFAISKNIRSANSSKRSSKHKHKKNTNTDLNIPSDVVEPAILRRSKSSYDTFDTKEKTLNLFDDVEEVTADTDAVPIEKNDMSFSKTNVFKTHNKKQKSHVIRNFLGLMFFLSLIGAGGWFVFYQGNISNLLPKAKTQIAHVIATGVIEVTVTENDVLIFLDDDDLQQSPWHGPVPRRFENVPLGNHVIKAVKEGFIPISINTNVTSEKISRVSVQMMPKIIEQQITSDPENVNIILRHNDVVAYQGNTPYVFSRLIKDNYSVVFDKEGYKPLLRNLSAMQDDQAPLHIVLVKAKQVKKKVKKKTKKQVKKKTKKKTKKKVKKQTKKKKSAYKKSRISRKRSKKSLKASSRTSKKNPAIKKKMGILQIGSRPSCDVYIDGKAIGRRTPIRQLHIKSGTHEITLVNDEYKIRHQFNIEIKSGETKKIIKKLLPK